MLQLLEQNGKKVWRELDLGGVRAAGALSKFYSEGDPKFRGSKELPILLPGLGFRAVHSHSPPIHALPPQPHPAWASRSGKEILLNPRQPRRGLGARRGEALMGRADAAPVAAEGGPRARGEQEQC